MTTAHTTHQLETFPAELRDRRQWVLWAIEERDGKRTKVPRRVDAPAIRASCTDPTSWGSFDEAVAALETAPEGISGAGFVFTAGDPFAGVDLDRCMGADGGSGGGPRPRARWGVIAVCRGSRWATG